MSRFRFELPYLPGLTRREPFAPGDLGYVPRRERLRAYNQVYPLIGGREAFPAMLDAIRIARRRVHLEMYIFSDDVVGREFQAAFIERARAGIEVRVLVDGLGSFGLSSRFLDELRAAGVEVQVFHPVAPWRRRWGLNKRDHQKILIVDDEIAFCGGINLTDENRPIEQGGGGWHDVHARVEGPAVFDLARLFRETWLEVGGSPFPEPELPAPRPDLPAHNALVEVISNEKLRARSRMRYAYMHAIRRAEKSIHIMNAYFIPDVGLRRAFGLAVKRGVDVRVIVPSTSDVAAVYYASRHLYARLLRRGVRIFEWPERMMHAKCGVIDGVWTTIGTYNLDRRSFLHNLEVGLVTIDRDLGERMELQFERDLVACREVTLGEWNRRSWWDQAMELFCYQWRYWL
ncbi:MAG: cardiolipin synthase ClsB [Planctomycetes bacterium]|nr:cardiolipin synthase ClsB [Planctomycetota bacterium]